MLKNLKFCLIFKSLVILVSGLKFLIVSVESRLLLRKNFHNYSPVQLKADAKIIIEKGFFTQVLDHFNTTDNRTWSQIYFLNRAFYKDGGPIFLFIGEEDAADPDDLSFTSWADYAKRLNAMIFLLEHRFYGNSHPTVDTSTTNLQFLSVRQALADLAEFTQAMQTKHNLKKNKWISFGGSYSGILSVWYRLKYPTLIYAAVASSAPIETIVNFKQYYQVVRKLLQVKGSINCLTEIKKATNSMAEFMKSGNSVKQTALKNLFRLCVAQNLSNPMDVYAFYQAVASDITTIVQYNGNRGRKGLYNANITIPIICKIMTDDTNGFSHPLERYAAVYDLIETKVFKNNCTDQREATTISEYQRTSWNSSYVSTSDRQFLYQTCTELGFFATSDFDDKKPFGPFPLIYFIKLCEKVFGKRFNLNFVETGVRKTNEEYGGKSPKVRRVIFINGSNDPYYPLGLRDNSTLPYKSDNLVIFIHGTAHAADVLLPSPKDLPQLRRAREKIFKQLSTWISL